MVGSLAAGIRTGNFPLGLTSPRSTRATACIDGLVHEYDAMYVGVCVRAAMSYGFLVATTTTGFPVVSSAFTRSRWLCEPVALEVATTTTSFASALLIALAIVAAPGAVPVSNSSVGTSRRRSACTRCAAGCAADVLDTER